MSDPVTNVEIEDVLSSIRRLVSEDARPAARRPDASGARPDRLVLTPALRVQEAPVSEPGPEPETAPDIRADVRPEPMLLTNPATATEAEESDPLPMDQLLRDITPDQPEPELEPEPEPEPVQDAPRPEPAVSDYASGMMTRLVEEEMSRVRREETPPAEDAAAGDPAEETNFVEALVDAVLEEVLDPAPVTERAAAVGEPDDADGGTAVEAEPDPAPQTEDTEALDDGDDITLEEKIAELEKLIGRGQSGFEPEVDVEPAPTFVHRPPQTLSWEDHEPEVEDEIGDRFLLGEDLSARAVSPGLQLDEDALRDMVSRMIRQELQGVLGERITRNVRKLVRREIHRVLMSQEFD